VRRRLLVLAILTALLAGVVWAVAGRGAEPGGGLSAEVELLQATPAAAGFERVYGPRAFDFPRDHGPHPTYQTEWWYYTGNLEAADGRHFGYQLTIFRQALAPAGSRPERASEWAADQVYFAHFALSDVAGGAHAASERFSRGAVGLAGAQGDPYRVWLEDWEIVAVDRAADRVRLRAADPADGGRAIDLVLTAERPPVLHGDAGYSPKSDEPGNASYYISFTRMATEGTVTVGGAALAVRGLSWMDHEWSTSALGPEAVGWDWFSLQLSDGHDLMLFQLRRRDGGVEPVSSGTLVAPDGSVRHLALVDMQIESLGGWTSPASGGTYPSRWRVRVPGSGLEIELEPYLADQELEVSFTYWEGAVRVRGQVAGQPVTGSGYVEMTGYVSGPGGARDR
jgi:predicted secreted hydrolase